ncbi:MAG: Fe-S cluster assembly protein SufD, partial [Bacteroidales bacterium]|nr:Fe-S cluster assembly protein SufD [Bacteroidales bacterium]
MSNKKVIEQPALKEELLKIYKDASHKILANDLEPVKRLRDRAINYFSDHGFPTERLEQWKSTDVLKALQHDYKVITEPDFGGVDTDKLLQCEIPDFDTHLFTELNGWYIAKGKPLTKFDNGVVVGSLAKAMTEYPDFFARHYGKIADYRLNGLVALNTAFAQDGIFIYVPDNVEMDKTIQMVNVTQKNDYVLVHNRNLVVMGKNSKLRLVHCDDSTNQETSFTNSVTEMYLDEGASLDHYKLQNLNDNSTLVNTSFYEQEAGSNLSTNAITLNGGLIRNESHVKLMGSHSNADVLGLYLVDKAQHVDNQVKIDHAVSDCTSNQHFKGITDDNAHAVFNGHILVRKDAQRTQAYQNSKNIAITDKAMVDAKPFLEIYADDVTCSHGATVGQLDDEAMFYLKTRGLNEDDARLLLMYAFAADIINYINIEPLK